MILQRPVCAASVGWVMAPSSESTDSLSPLSSSSKTWNERCCSASLRFSTSSHRSMLRPVRSKSPFPRSPFPVPREVHF